MIDTIGLEIPISDAAAGRIKALGSRCRHIDDCREGEVIEVWSCVEAEVVEPTWSRTVACRVVEGRGYHMDYGSVLRFPSFSLCKFVYGENVHLLYDLTRALGVFCDALMRTFDLVAPEDIGPVEQWRVVRLDLCYSWCVGERGAHQLIEWAKSSSYSRKKASTYETSVLWVGSSYSCKLYCKGPEFLQHDLPVMIKAGLRSAVELGTLADLARGIIRFEAGLRARYLSSYFGKRFVQVADLDREFMEGRLLFFLRRWAMGLKAEVWQFEDCLERIHEYFGARGTPRAQAKAVQMAGFYSLLFRLGPARLRATMRKSTFYDSMAALKRAGVALVGLDDLPEDLAALRFEVPHESAPNLEDDYSLWVRRAS